MKKLLAVSGFIVLVLLYPRVCVWAQDQGAVQRLGVDFPPQKLGDRSLLVGESIVETTSVATWVRPKVSVLIYDQGLRTVLGRGNVTMSGRGAKQIAVTSVHFDSAGTFAVVRRIDGIGANDGVRHRYAFYWLVTAHWPVIPTEPDSVYYYGESAIFSFAAGHVDQRAYSYQILRDGESVLGGEGAVVPLDQLWRGKLDGLGEFQVRGYFRGSPFIYADSTRKVLRRSAWTIRVEVPAQRELLSLWWDSTRYEERKLAGAPPALDLAAQSSFLNPLQFRFAASGPFYEGLYLIPAAISRIEVTATPAAFLPADPARAVRVSSETNGLWQVIELQPLETFLERTPPDAPAEVTLRFRITDQFGRVTQRMYKSRVYSSHY